MLVTDLEQRRKKILEHVIEVYISTASPVGSAAIARRLQANLSSATIRNTMMQLEEEGLLEQPHTSAGRVPTEQGYRFYVDSVMEVQRLSPDEIRHMAQAIQSEMVELDHLPERVSQVLADLTEEAAFVVAPTVKQSTVRQIELVPLGGGRFLCVLVGSEARYASHLIEISEPLTPDEAVTLVRFLNTELVGLPFRDLLSLLERRLLAERDSFYYLVKRALDILQHALATEPSERFYWGGTRYVVAQPEFRRDPAKAEVLLRGLEVHHDLEDRVCQDLEAGAVQVRIGRELEVDGFEDCSYVAAPLTSGGNVRGGVGVLGPTRMDYRRMSALVEGMARSMSELMATQESLDES